MKTQHKPHSFAAVLAVLSTGTETFQLMKTRLTMLKLLIVLCSTLATTAVFGQATVFTWTNSAGGELSIAANWNPNGLPQPRGSGANANLIQDFMLFDGQTAGPLTVTGNSSAGMGGASGAPALGLVISVSANQVNSLMIRSTINPSGAHRYSDIYITNGAGAFHLGDNSGNRMLMTWGTVGGQIHNFVNDSANAATIYTNASFQYGGGGAHNFVFNGTGNWNVTNNLWTVNGSPTVITKQGSGTMTWATGFHSGGIPNSTLQGPTTISGGTLIIKGTGLFVGIVGNTSMANNGTLLKFDPGSGSDTWPFNISGVAPIQVSSGTLTLGGANTFSGNINLTGGELIASSIENFGVNGPLGQGGTISFNGGTLGWSLVNAFDYSSRFDASANQAYNLDTGGASPTLATGLTSTGGSLTKLGGGTLTLAGTNTYTGLTTVSAGELLFQGTKAGNANITVSDGATLGVVENDSQITPTTLTLGTATGVILEFNNVTNHTVATLAPNNLVSAGTVTINVNSGRFILIGETFALLKWTSGSAPAVSLGFLAGAGGHLTTNGNEIDVVIDNPPYIWTGLNSAVWDTLTINWNRNALPTTWVNGNFALLDDSSTITNITLLGTITPTNASINNSSSPYSITNNPGNVIGGGGSLTKTGNGTLTLPGGANTYTGVTTIGGGVVGIDVLANGGLASDIGAASSGSGNIVLNGGTLLYTGPGVSIDRLFSVGPGGGTIDNEGLAALAFANTGSLGMSGNGPRTLTITGPNAFGDTIASAIVNHPAGTSLRKTGLGTWILTGTNTYAGGTTLLEGALQVGTGGPSGTLGSGNISTATGTSIDFQRTGTLTVPGAISGNASVANDGTGTVILANNNSYTGGTTINAGTLQVGNGGGTGKLDGGSPIVNNSLIVFNTAGSFTYIGGGLISGTGNVIVQGGGVQKFIGANSYTGWTRIDAGSTFQPSQGNTGTLLSSVVTNNGTLKLVRQDTGVFIYNGPIVGTGKLLKGLNNFNPGDVTLTGTNSYTGGTFIGGGTIIFGDGASPGSVPFANNVTFTNNFDTSDDQPRTLTLFRPEDIVFSGNIVTNFASPQINQGIVQQNGGGLLTLTGNNSYGGGTVVNAGALAIGNGGASGSVGSGPVTINNGNNGIPLVINRTGILNIPGAISGVGVSVVESGSGSLFLNGVNTYNGSTTISNGTFGGSGTISGPGPVTLMAGTTLAPGASIGTLTINSDLSIGGNLRIDVNKTLAQSNDLVVVSGILTNTGTGTLTVANQNLNSPIASGDTFILFSQAVSNGAAITVTGGRVASWINNLAVDGSITAGTSAAPLPTLNFANNGGTNMQISWSDSFSTFKLQTQTNKLTVGISTNWLDYPGGGTSPVTVPIVKTNGAVFIRLKLVSTP